MSDTVCLDQRQLDAPLLHKYGRLIDSSAAQWLSPAPLHHNAGCSDRHHCRGSHLEEAGPHVQRRADGEAARGAALDGQAVPTGVPLLRCRRAHADEGQVPLLPRFSFRS